MASLDEPPPPSFFGKLPVELLKHIVAVVREQDEEFWKLGVQTTGPPRYDTDVEFVDEHGEEVEPSKGMWGPWYGYQLSALSLCNKQLRVLCMPYLFETTTASQLNEPAFTVGKIDDTVCRHVRHLDIVDNPSDELRDDAFFAIASALMRLPRLERLTLSGNRLPFFVENPELEDETLESGLFRSYAERRRAQTEVKRRNLTREAFGELASRITSLRLRHAEASHLFGVLKHLASPASLRGLRVNTNSSFFAQTSASFEEAFGRLALEELEIRVPGWGLSFHSSWSDVRLPTVTSFTFQIPPTAVNDAIKFINSAMPALQKLHLEQMEGHLDPPPSPADPPIALLQLTHLTISGPPDVTAFLSLFSASPLQRVTFLLSQPNTYIGLFLRSILPLESLSPSVRHLHLEVCGQNRPSDLDTYRSSLTRRGITATILWTPSSIFCLHEGDPADEPAADAGQEEADARQEAAITETLDWAKRRLEWLSAVGDRKGVDELAETLEWVRERQLIETV
ncbi:hypothetical protein JCM6882_009752 [Rhodosporidiobolus microsporus]